MDDKQRNDVPDAVRRIIQGMTGQALARCDRLGIAHEDFYRAMLEEQKAHPEVSVAQLFERTFRRLLVDRLADMGRSIAKGKPLDTEVLDDAVWSVYALRSDPMHGRKLPPDAVPVILPELERRFQELAKKWRRETSHLSSASRMARHEAYQQIIGMGPAAIPLLLRELQRKPDHWFIALSTITGANPITPESAGKVSEMAQAWIRWGQAEGYIA